MEIKTLYPPLVDTYMPAFEATFEEQIETTICKVYFSISDFNVFEQIGKVMITVTNQDNNITALKTSGKEEEKLYTYPNAIKVFNTVPTEILDSEGQSTGEFYPFVKKDDKGYYVEIETRDLKEGFVLNKYYKVQFRFADNEAAAAYEKKSEGSWLNEYKTHFSEWSTICLVRKISQSSIISTSFKKEGEKAIFYGDVFYFTGALIFNDEIEKETLESYTITLYSNEKEVFKSPICYSNNYNNINQIEYYSNYRLNDIRDEENPFGDYLLKVSITTNNGFTKEEIIVFEKAKESVDRDLKQELFVIPEESLARVNLYYGENKFEGGSPDLSEKDYTLIFRRASSRDNFKAWEIINVIKAEDLNEFFFDYSIESGIWYRYSVQGKRPDGTYTIMKIYETPVICLYEHMYIVGKDKQLKISLNSKISSPKINVSEAKMDTIGSVYPFIKRNNAMRYKQYQISGTISFLDNYAQACLQDNKFINENGEVLTEDSENSSLISMFIKDSDILEQSEYIKNLYSDYNNKNRITEYNDFIKEREFRKLVIDFLYDDEVKLIKSLTEGNTLGRLMEINLSPNQTLFNYIYDFSATVYEVDEFNLDNLEKYGIVSLKREIPQEVPDVGV